jgi:predicted lipoprotein with Yx(FWY)xxD motif
MKEGGESMEEKQAEEKSGYGKRPLWQWIVLYLIVAVVVYGAIYYLFLNKQNPYSSSSSANKSVQTQQMQGSPQTMQNSVYKVMSKEKVGVVMTDTQGKTLYTFAKDTTGVSNCASGKCLQNWPPYTAQSQTGTFPANITVIERSDGTLQYAWKGMPLYYYIKDKDSEDAYGDGVGGVWSVVK